MKISNPDNCNKKYKYELIDEDHFSKNVILVGDKQDHLKTIKEMMGNFLDSCKDQASCIKISHPYELKRTIDEMQADGRYPDYIVWKGISKYACETLDESSAKFVFEAAMKKVIDRNRTKVIPMASSRSDRSYMTKMGAVNFSSESPFDLFKYIWKNQDILKNVEKPKTEKVLFVGQDHDDKIGFLKVRHAVKGVKNINYQSCDKLENICQFFQKNPSKISRIILSGQVIDIYDINTIVKSVKEPLSNGVKEVGILYEGACGEQERINKINTVLNRLRQFGEANWYICKMEWAKQIEKAQTGH